MEVQIQPKLKFKGVDFVNVQCSQQQSYDKDQMPALQLDIKPKVFYPQDRPLEFTIVFDVGIIAEGYFSISIVAFGFFEFDQTIEDEALRKSFINVNTAAIVFPYIRSFVTTLTANLGAGFVPLVLPPQFFMGALEEHTFVASPTQSLPQGSL